MEIQDLVWKQKTLQFFALRPHHNPSLYCHFQGGNGRSSVAVGWLHETSKERIRDCEGSWGGEEAIGEEGGGEYWVSLAGTSHPASDGQVGTTLSLFFLNPLSPAAVQRLPQTRPPSMMASARQRAGSHNSAARFLGFTVPEVVSFPNPRKQEEEKSGGELYYSWGDLTFPTRGGGGLITK